MRMRTRTVQASVGKVPVSYGEMRMRNDDGMSNVVCPNCRRTTMDLVDVAYETAGAESWISSWKTCPDCREILEQAVKSREN
jgi:ssDNA-binding Zn-finger/Zn-ribbon topoisomerase 1